MSRIDKHNYLMKFLLTIAVISGHTYSAVSQQTFDCSKVADFPIDVQKASGVWYELARSPPSKVPACVSATAPSAIEDNTYTLNINYRNNVNNGWANTDEVYKFPWDEVQKGSFRFVFGENGGTQLTFVYKIVSIDANYTMAAICVLNNANNAGFKLMSRHRTLSPDMESKIQQLLNFYGIGNAVTWVEQSEKCNAAAAIHVSIFLMVITIFGAFRP